MFKQWEEGDETFHSELMVPVLLIYGAEDRFVTLQEEKWMHEVCLFVYDNIILKEPPNLL